MELVFTKNFGEIKYETDKLITFPAGLPGYPDDRRYLMMDMEETGGTFFWLQSVDDGEVCFPLMDVYKAIPDYDPHVDPDELSDLGEIANDSLVVYNIAVIPEDIGQTRVNLRAPVIINLDTRRGKQVICANEDYAVRHLIMDELRQALREESAC
jgi:flagellar assembly factor FliW